MIKKFTFRKSTSFDLSVNLYRYEHEIEAYRIEPENEKDEKERLKYKKAIKRQTSDEHYYHGIDKMSYVYSNDYINTVTLRKSVFKNGPVTITQHGQFVTINIQKEYIPIDENLETYIESIFKYLVFYKRLFILPRKRITLDHQTGSVKVEVRQENDVETEEEFFKRIYSLRKLKCIELCFDMHFNIRNYFDMKLFNIVKSTIYSKADYRVYGSMNVKKSMLCIYDKRKEQKERKHKELSCTFERFEIRLFDTSFKVIQEGNNGLLDCTYEELIVKLTPLIRKHLKKLNIDFSSFLSVLPSNQIQLRKILENL